MHRAVDPSTFRWRPSPLQQPSTYQYSPSPWALSQRNTLSRLVVSLLQLTASARYTQDAHRPSLDCPPLPPSHYHRHRDGLRSLHLLSPWRPNIQIHSSNSPHRPGLLPGLFLWLLLQLSLHRQWLLFSDPRNLRQSSQSIPNRCLCTARYRTLPFSIRIPAGSVPTARVYVHVGKADVEKWNNGGGAT